MRSLTLASILALLTTPAMGHDFKVGDLTIAHPFSFETAPTARAGAGYFEVTNTGDTPDRLIAAKADFPRVMLHQSVMDGDVAKMEHVMGGVEIRPGETLSFAPGGYHVMFMGLSEGFAVGDEINATLVFESAGSIDVVFKVEERTEAEMDHSSHGN